MAAVSGATVIETPLFSPRDEGTDWSSWISEAPANSVSGEIVASNPEDGVAWVNSGPAELARFITSNNAMAGVGSITGEMLVMSDRAILLLYGSDAAFTVCRLNLLSMDSSSLSTLLEGELFGTAPGTTEPPRGRADVPPASGSDDPQIRFVYAGTFGLDPAEWASFSQTITSDRLVLSLAGPDGIFQNVMFQSIPEPSVTALVLGAMACLGRRRFFKIPSSQFPPRQS